MKLPASFVTSVVLVCSFAVCVFATSGCGLFSRKAEASNIQAVTPPPDPTATLKTKVDEEVGKVREDFKTLKTQFEDMKQIAATAGAGVQGVIVAAGQVADELTKNAVIKEANAVSASLASIASPDPLATAQAEARAGAVSAEKLKKLKEENASTLAALQKANDAVEKNTADLAAKQKEIDAQETKLGELQRRIDQAGTKATEEEKKYNGTRERLIRNNTAFETALAEGARTQWSVVVRCSGIAIILAGLLTVALTSGESLWQGATLLLVGMAVVGLGLGFDSLWGSPLFGYEMSLVGLAAAIAAGWCACYFWQSHQLYRKTTAALQDLKDECEATHGDAWNEAREHLKYRVGAASSFWGQVLNQRLMSRGLKTQNPEPTSGASPTSVPPS